MDEMELLSNQLFKEIRRIIEDVKQELAVNVNAVTTIVNWNIGLKLNQHLLKSKRADYGKEIVKSLAEKLKREYGRGWSEKQLRHCLRIAKTFPDKEIIYALSRQLSWTHFRTVMYLNDSLKREFYIEMTKIERWNTRTLSSKINSMLYERTAISKKPEELIKEELKKLREENQLSLDLVFRDPYILDFLGLKDRYSEKDLEESILLELENFILEFGRGFTFVERQKSMLIDNESFKLDLLFFHRKLRRLIAVELKLGKFKASYKGQMELYLRYLEKYEMEKGEETPIGLILCGEGATEQIELLQLDESGIRVAEYILELPPKEVLKEKLNKVIKNERNRLKRRNS